MNKLIKYEFRASARFMLPVLAIALVSGILMVISYSVNSNFGLMRFLCTVVFILSLVAAGILCVVALIGRFYRNTMTDNAYLTMTLPLNVHEFIWGEVISSFLWALIAGAVLVLVMILAMWLSGAIDFGWMYRQLLHQLPNLQQQLAEAGFSRGRITGIVIESVFSGILSFVFFCLHVYLACALGQMVAQHKIFLSVAAYIGLNIVNSVVTSAASQAFTTTNVWNNGSFAVTLSVSSGGMIALLVVGIGIYYAVTAWLLKNKLNLA